MEHDLKILPDYFGEVRSGLKTFEIRKNDRNFRLGDRLFLREYKNGKFTGQVEEVLITYMTDYAQKDGYVVMGISKCEHE